jgi:hypothetical protein
MTVSAWPWQFRKIDGVWHRRAANSSDRWQRIRVERVGEPAQPRMSNRNKHKIAPPTLNRITWD